MMEADPEKQGSATEVGVDEDLQKDPPDSGNDVGDSSERTGSIDAEAALRKLKRCGPWRILTYSLICLGVNIPGAWHMLSIVFIGGEPDGFQCFRPTSNDANRNKIVPEIRISEKTCHLPENHTTVCPHGFTYYTKSGPTIVTDWDLVCNRNYLSETSQVVFSVGVMAGALFIPSLSDRFGRRPVHLICQGVAIVFGVGLAFSDSITTFIVLRFFLGALREGLGLSGIVMACEMFPAALRPMAGITLQFFWSAAWLLLTLLAYLIRNWRHLQLTLSVISVLPAAALWFVPESIVWLVAKGKLEEAEKILQRANTFDGRKGSPDYFLVDLKKEEKPSTSSKKDNEIELGEVAKSKAKDTEKPLPKYTIFSITKSKKLCFYTLCMCFLWFINIVVYYGLSLGASLWRGSDRYLLFLLSGLVEIPAYAFALVLTRSCGRRVPLTIFHVTAAVGLFAMLYGKFSQYGIMVSSMAMVGKFGITASLAILVLYSNEIFPTTLRNAGFGLAAMTGRLGGILAPVFVYVSKEEDNIPILVFALLAVVAVVLGIAPPEPANKPLPQTMEDIEEWEPGCISFSRWSKERSAKLCSCDDSDSETESVEKLEDQGEEKKL